jgi:hypothetical protein
LVDEDISLSKSDLKITDVFAKTFFRQFNNFLIIYAAKHFVFTFLFLLSFSGDAFLPPWATDQQCD